jgi:hypothetical protein
MPRLVNHAQQKGEDVRPQIKIALPVAWAVTLLIEGSLDVAARDAVPKLNVSTSCESAARRLVFVNSSKEACIKHEMQAHEVLVRHWSQYAKVDKASCVSKVTRRGRSRRARSSPSGCGGSAC